MTSTVVVGGGLAGLLAARRHAAEGARVTLVEAGDTLGGAVADCEVAGISVNAGAEAYALTSGSVGALVDELGLGDRVVSPVAGLGSRLVSDAGSLPSPAGGLLGIPGDPLAPDARAVLGLPGALRAWAERFLHPAYALDEGVTIGSYVRRRMGRRVAERLVAPVVGGVHSADPETLELGAVQPRLAGAVREHGSLAAAVRALRPGGDNATRASVGTAVHSLTPTMAALPEALAADVRARGGEIRTASPAEAVERSGAGWVVRTARDARHADTLVLATPPDTAGALLRDAAPQVAAAIPDAPSSPVRLVVLVLDAPALDAAPSGTGALVAAGTRGVRAKALTHASAKWAHVREAARAHGPHVHVVRLSYGRPGEPLPPDDATTVDLALADASSILRTTLTRAHLRGSRTVTWQGAMRQPRPGHREALRHLDTLLAGGSLELVGSWRDGTGLDAIVAADRRRRSPILTKGSRP